MGGRALTDVRAHFSASHRRPNGHFHGHTYSVWAAFPAGEDAERLQSQLRSALVRWHEKQIPDEFWSGEALAKAICEDLDGCVRVRVERGPEGIAAEWWAA